MNILHITDFHYASGNSRQIKVVNSIIKAIREAKYKIDLVLFTGDLVHNGSKREDFNNANVALFDELSDKLNIPKENILFCPGNHDIDRNKIHGAMKAFIDSQVNSNDKLNSFYKKSTETVFLDSLKPSENFYEFLKEYHKPDSNNLFKSLYSIHYRTINQKKLGIVVLNTAWLSAIDNVSPRHDDKGSLLLPLELLEEVKSSLGNVDRRIILLHHPFYFLREFNFYNVESFVHNEFDLMFSGHVHKTGAASRYSGSNGIFEHVGKASLSTNENLGCSLIVLDDNEENLIHVNELTIIEENETCHIAEPISHVIPVGSNKQEIISFRKKLFDKIALEKENANNLLLLKEEERTEDFLTTYNHPILKKDAEGGLENKNTPVYGLAELVTCEENYVILGKDKCGKTSLLKRIQLECLLNYSSIQKIPFYFDAKEYDSKLETNFNIDQHVKNYFNVNSSKTQQILSSKNFILLVDNYSPNTGMANYLNSFFLNHPELSFVICSEYNLSRTVDVFQFGDLTYEKLFFHDLRRKEIIAYTEKRLSSTNRKEEIQEKIIQLCKQLELPLNYWTISLLLLIHNKSSDSYSKNLFSILEVCVDEIFGKKQIMLTHKKISFDQLKTICAELAKELFLNYKEDTFSAPYKFVIGQIEKTILTNERISANSREVFDYLVSCSILKRKDENDFFVFRLNGFFEYFLALQMTKDEEFKNEILNDEVKYLAFKNQLEIYCGFKRNDFDFLLNVFKKTQKKLNPIFSKYQKNKDLELISKIQEPEKVEEACRKINVNKSLSANEKAEIEDSTDVLNINAEVHEIVEMDPNIINSELIERYLAILSRTFRNLDDITDNKERIMEIFDFIVSSYCDFGFFIINEISELVKEEANQDLKIDLERLPELNLLKFISNFSPLLSQGMLYDGLGHFSLERLTKGEIEKLENTASNNQYKLFMLYFLLLDIDLSTNKEYIFKAMENIRLPILKYILFVKLNYYLAFKCGNNKSLQKEISNLIQKARLNFDKKADLSEIQKEIQGKKRASLNYKESL